MKIEVNGHSLYYREQGPTEGLPVVFIHGFPFSHRMWDPQLKALPGSYRGVAYDIRGHGDSAVGNGQYSVEFFVDDLIGLLDHLAIDQGVVCGLSMGGYIALRALERHPDRFQGLVLCDTRSTADPDATRVDRAKTITAVKTNGVQPFAEGFAKAVFAPASFAAIPLVVQQIQDIITATDPLSIGGTLLALAARTDTTPALSGITIPTLILVGEHDALTPPADAEAMQAQLPNAELHVIPGAAHLSNLENPTVFNRHLLAFLERF